MVYSDYVKVAKFQSTHPARGATSFLELPSPPLSDFNPRTPRGVRLRVHKAVNDVVPDFNPRTPRGVRLM